ncbi:MAG TPA: SRPBCC domain-containing protein [Pyrinomonadaceae bacterium]|nr:SRPBCC domain-containing protein [Pyrinomonadaceae bacterium]
MKNNLKSDHPVTNEAAKAATGKTLDQWFAELDKADGLKLGRREINNRLQGEKVDPWWASTIAVEFEKHHDVRKKDGFFEGYFVCSTKTIAAPPAEVYKAWASGPELSKWFGDASKADVKDGGTFQNKDGDKGIFLRVRENKDLRMTFEGNGLSAPTQVDVQFQDKGKGKTGLLVNHTRIQTREEADGLRAAWAQALDRLKAACES